jgi:hypothetical protein
VVIDPVSAENAQTNEAIFGQSFRNTFGVVDSHVVEVQRRMGEKPQSPTVK